MPKSSASEDNGDAAVPPAPAAPEDSDTEDESDQVIEESHGGRWQKRREPVTQRDVPGIDAAYLAMDTEEGVEVVWNEVRISDKKASKSQLEKIRQVFDNLIQLEHPNIVKFHQYWTDTNPGPKRVVFITEYMSSGSLKQFLKKTKTNNRTLKAWKRWCRQILSALTYLHSCNPPIIHGNLTTDTIFIQHNGLIKIGSDLGGSQLRRVLGISSPETSASEAMTTAVDIYSFGICALELAASELPSNGDAVITSDSIKKALEALNNDKQKDFIGKCLVEDPLMRPSARELLFHPVLFEVPALKLLAGHIFVQNAIAGLLPESVIDKAYQTHYEPDHIIGNLSFGGARPPIVFNIGDVFEKIYGKAGFTLDLDKFLEDVRNGLYPLAVFQYCAQPADPGTRSSSPQGTDEINDQGREEVSQTESRKIVSMSCNIVYKDPVTSLAKLTLVLRLEDKMNRQLTCEFNFEEPPTHLAHELVFHGFIHPEDELKVRDIIDRAREQTSFSSLSGDTLEPSPMSTLIH